MDLFISHSMPHPGCAVQHQLRRLISVEKVVRPDSDLMTAEFAADCCMMSLAVMGLDGSLKEEFLLMRFHCTHDSTTSIEHVRYRPHLPLTTIAFISTQNDYITDPQGFWSADCGVVTSRVFPQYLAEIL